MRNRARAAFKGGELEYTHRAVPDDGAGLLELRRQDLRGLRADVQNQVVFLHLGGGLGGGGRVGSKGLGCDHVGGNGHGCAARLHGGDHGAGFVKQARLGQALADGQTGRKHEGVGNAAADDELIDLFGQALEDGEFGGHLGARHDGHQRALGRQQRLGDGVHFSRQQRTGAGDGGKLGDAIGAGFGAVRGAKGVVHKDVAQGGHLARQRFVVLLFALVDAAVLQQHHLPGLHRLACHQHAIDPVGHQRHGAAQQFLHARRHRRERVGGGEGTFGRAAQVRCHHHAGTGVQRHADGGHAGADARVFGDVARVVLRHVQVGTDENALAGHLAARAQVRKADHIHGVSSVGLAPL